MSKFIYNINLNGNDIQYSELSVHVYKIILKSLLGEMPLPKVVFTNVNKILEEYTNLTKEKIEKLNFIDFFILLTNIRMLSLGNGIDLSLTKDDKTFKISLNVDKILNIFESIKNLYIKSNILNVGDYKIEFKLPTILELLSYENAIDAQLDGVIFIKSIQHINIPEVYIEMGNNLTIEERNAIFNKFPIIMTTKILKHLKEQLNIMQKIDLMDILGNHESLSEYKIPFDVNIYNLAFFVKILFLDDLKSIYNNIYSLTTNAHMSGEYLESCTVGEFKIFVSNLKSSQKDSDTPIPQTIGNPDGFDEFN